MKLGDVQGLIFSGYRALPCSLVVLLDFSAGDPRGFLRRLLPGVTSAAERASPSRNLALTASGLAALGLDERTLLGFSEEFRQGMAEGKRSLRLGDVGEDAPEGWEFGGERDRIDAVLLIYAADRVGLAEERAEIERSLGRFAIGARALETYLREDGREHFGFRMGVSEPGLTRRAARRGRERVPLGEFLLGHRNALGERTPYPSAPPLRSTRDLGVRIGERAVPLGRNGSYLVVRKIEQQTDAFARFSTSSGEGASALAACMVGRWANGAPLALQREPPREDERYSERPFGYREDPLGAGCPLDAHVRRANPRDLLGPRALQHRLLRRGRLYGPEAAAAQKPERLPERAAAAQKPERLPALEGERGLLFMALNADLARQFETVQASFLQGYAGLGERGVGDALLYPGEKARFVRVRGGVYAFLPSISALGYLAELGRR